MAKTSKLGVLGLPPESRVRVYDHVLRPIVREAGILRDLRAPDEWPLNLLGTYHSLMLTCTTINLEL